MSQRNWIVGIVIAVMGWCASANPGMADLVISIDAATEELFAAEMASAAVGDAVDDLVELRSLGLSNFQLFGKPVSELWVSDNGNLNSNGNSAFYPQPIDAVSPAANVIAPLWDDYLMVKLPDGYVPMNRVVESRLAETYYSVTWQNIRLFNETVSGTGFPDTIRTLQATLFGADTTIRGFDFHTNDITFSYLSFDGTTSSFVDDAVESTLPEGKSQLNASIGISGVDGGWVEMFGDTDNSGLFQADEAAAVLPWTDRQFVLIRETTDVGGNFQNYNLTIEQFPEAVPEPSTIALALIAFTGMCLYRWRFCQGIA